MSRTIPFVAAVFSFTLTGSAFAQDAGQKAFTDANCNRCHDVQSKEIAATVSSEKMKGPDLSKIGEKHDAAWIMQYVKKEVQLNDKNHRMPWKGSDDDLKVIADWVASLK